MRVTPYTQLTPGDKGVDITTYYENDLFKNLVVKNTMWVQSYF